VRHIVNLGLHTHEKALPDEAASVSRLGMTHIHIPVDSAPERPRLRAILRRDGAVDGCPIARSLHCQRAGLGLYRYRRDVLGMDETQARAEMEAVWQPRGVWVDFVERRGEGRD
jgi:hypothetical protein